MLHSITVQICNSFAATAKLRPVELPLSSEQPHGAPTLELAFKYVAGLLLHSLIGTSIYITNAETHGSPEPIRFFPLNFHSVMTHFARLEVALTTYHCAHGPEVVQKPTTRAPIKLQIAED